MKNIKGFTLMELIIVIAIIMILAGAIIVRMGAGADKAKVAKAVTEMENIVAAYRAFYGDVTYWPAYHNSFSNPSDLGLIKAANATQVINDSGTVMAPPANFTTVWKGPYLVAYSYPKDPWGTYYYDVGYHAGSGILAVVSAGPNKIWESEPGWYTTGQASGDDIIMLINRFKS